MKKLAFFEFHSTNVFRPRENMVHVANDSISIRIFRRMRTVPLIGMKQPLLNHAIMGLETVLEIMCEGKPAVRYRWKLYNLKGKSTKLAQRGETDEHGLSGDIHIGFSPLSQSYRLSIYTPKKLAEALPLPSF